MISKAIRYYIFVCFGAGGHMDLRFFCLAYLRTGGDVKAIWTYVCACFSACGHMDLRLCMCERRRRYGVTSLHIAAPAAILIYVSAYRSVAGEVDEANVAVA